MEDIKNTVASLLKKLERQKLSCQDDPALWIKKILTKKELKHIKIDYFRQGVLRIKVDSSVWLFALRLRKEDLLKRISLYTSNIKDIRFILEKT